MNSGIPRHSLLPILAGAIALALGVLIAIPQWQMGIVVLALAAPVALALGSRYPEAIFALFLTVGFFKASLPSAIDATLVLAFAVGVVVVFHFGRFGLPEKATVGWLFLGLVAVIGVGLVGSEAPAYGSDKALRFAILGGVAVWGALFIHQTDQRVDRLLLSLFAVGLTMSVIALASGGGLHGEERLTALGSNTIALGRASAIAIAVSASWLMWKREHRVAVVLCSAVATAALMGSGSRGPALSLAVSLVGLMLVRLAASRGRSFRALAVAALLAGIGATAIVGAPAVSVERYGLLLEGGGASAQARGVLAQEAIRLFYREPVWGIGTGSFAAYQTQLVYPHNLVLEIAAENGVFAVIILLTFLGLAISAAIRAVWLKPGYLSDAVFLIVIASAANSLLSGDVNANRILYAFCAIAFVRLQRLSRGVT